MYDVTQLKQDLEGMMHGTTLNQIQGIDPLINRAARQILMDVDPQETKRSLMLVNPVYSSVFDYSLPVDLKGNKIIDIFPQVDRQPWDRANQTYNQPFDLTKTTLLGDQFTINFNNAVKTLRLSEPTLIPAVVLNPADSINSSGLWSTGGTASNLTVDNVNFASGSGSLKFDLAVGANPSEGYLEDSTVPAIDLSTHYNQSTLFWYVYLPTASDFNFVKLRWGSSSVDYYEQSATTTFEGTVFQTGWNFLGVPWLGATVVGSPDPSSITYLRVTYNYNGNQQIATRLDNIISQLGTIMNIEYYSKYLFRDASTGAFQETVTSDTNLINLDTETYNLLTYQVGLLATQQQSGAEGSFDTKWFQDAYTTALKRYKAMYKSEITKPQEAYYTMPYPNWNRWWGRRW